MKKEVSMLVYGYLIDMELFQSIGNNVLIGVHLFRSVFMYCIKQN